MFCMILNRVGFACRVPYEFEGYYNFVAVLTVSCSKKDSCYESLGCCVTSVMGVMSRWGVECFV